MIFTSSWLTNLKLLYKIPKIIEKFWISKPLISKYWRYCHFILSPGYSYFRNGLIRFHRYWLLRSEGKRVLIFRQNNPQMLKMYVKVFFIFSIHKNDYVRDKTSSKWWLSRLSILIAVSILFPVQINPIRVKGVAHSAPLSCLSTKFGKMHAYFWLEIGDFS